MIVPVDETNLLQAATIHSISWKESHRAFCTPDFIETHTPDRQREYLRNKMNNGTKLYMLVEEKPIGVVSVTKGLIEDLCNGVQREHNKKLNNGLPILHKVPPKRDYGRYFCIMAEKGGTSHGGLTEKLSLFFHAKKQEVNAYGR